MSRFVSSIDAIIAMEHSDIADLRAMSLSERAELLEVACSGAVDIEVERARLGLPPATSTPWPQSTWDYLAEWSRRGR
jgi:hypothetical protein